MLKYADEKHHEVVDTITGETYAPWLWSWLVFVQPRLDAGETIAPWKSGEELLEEARQEKIGEINTAFQATELNPVVVGGHAYRGGFQSGLAIDAQRRAMVEYATVNPLAGITTVDFFDVSGAMVTLPLSSETEIDALDVCIALHQSASANAFKCAQLIAAAMSATTIEAINAIHW